jgi:hypothetical protein
MITWGFTVYFKPAHPWDSLNTVALTSEAYLKPMPFGWHISLFYAIWPTIRLSLWDALKLSPLITQVGSLKPRAYRKWVAITII